MNFMRAAGACFKAACRVPPAAAAAADKAELTATIAPYNTDTLILLTTLLMNDGLVR